MTTTPGATLDIPRERLAAFCEKWKITELSLFGSVVRDDFRDDSDVDVLVVFGPDAPWSAFEWPDMTEELSGIFGGRVIDLVEKSTIKNPYLRPRILSNSRVVYAA